MAIIVAYWSGTGNTEKGAELIAEGIREAGKEAEVVNVEKFAPEGSIRDGLVGDYTILAAKAVLDGVISVVLAASLGSGVFLSIIPVALYQGGITVLATFLEPFMTDLLISNMSLVGSVLVLGIGFNLLFDKKVVKVGNLLPAVLMPVLWQVILKIVNLL